MFKVPLNWFFELSHNANHIATVPFYLLTLNLIPLQNNYEINSCGVICNQTVTKQYYKID